VASLLALLALVTLAVKTWVEHNSVSHHANPLLSPEPVK
jgi:ABC-type sulfate transport system permease subunit